MPQSKPFRSVNIPAAFDRDPWPETSSSASGDSENFDESAVLAFLKELTAAGNHGLDPMLAAITDVARQLTGASGAALAMWKEGAMMCRARSGDIAPVIGAQLSAKTGISGECLRTGKIQHCSDTENDPLVDLEVCRSLGLRSIAVLPIRGLRGINGILEVFSTRPAAFTEQHIAFLQKLALLAEQARISQPESASSQLPAEIEATQGSVALPASDEVENVALAFWRTRSRPFVLGAIGLLAISLLALAIWRGWEGPERANGKTQAAPSSASPAIGSAASAGADTANTATLDVAIGHAPESSAVSKTNPGESVNPVQLYPSSEKPSAGSPVKLASKVAAVAGKKTQALSSHDVAPNVVVTHGAPDSRTASKARARSESQTNLQTEANPSPEPPPSIPASVAGPSPLNGVLSAKASLPGLGVPVSRGVSGGRLVRRVPPVYPAQARLRHLEGMVILAAVIMEDGTVRDVKVIEGPPLLAQSAVDAVKGWRYKPYELDGKPVKNEIRITVDFKLPNH